jgi:two-component system sensor histidine kinase SenX3
VSIGREASGDASPFEATVAALPVGMVIAAGDGTVIYDDVEAKLATLGYHHHVLIEREVQALVTDAKAGVFRSLTLEVFGPPKSYFSLMSTALPRSGPGAFLVTVEDVSDRRRLEEVRRDFVANVSHELKTPVGAILLLADTLVGEQDPATQARLARRILDEGDRLAQLVTDLLDLSRIEQAAELPTTEVPLAAILSECLERYQLPAERKGIRLRLELAQPALSVLGDRWQLLSAISNLVDNAIKYSEPATEVLLWLGELDGCAVIRVADQGIGIPARDLARIFERFYRVEADRSRATGGTGLGLSIVKHVVEAHRGRIEVSSLEGVGTTFTITLPKVTP